jgi:hypothetical protein
MVRIVRLGEETVEISRNSDSVGAMGKNMSRSNDQFRRLGALEGWESWLSCLFPTLVGLKSDFPVSDQIPDSGVGNERLLISQGKQGSASVQSHK